MNIYQAGLNPASHLLNLGIIMNKKEFIEKILEVKEWMCLNCPDKNQCQVAFCETVRIRAGL